MADDGWSQVASKKTKSKTAAAASNSSAPQVVAGVSQPAKDQLASIRAQVAALRAGKMPEPAPQSAPRPTTTALRTGPASASTRASGGPATPAGPPPAEVLRRLNALPEGEDMQSKLNGDKYYQAFARATMDTSGNLHVRFHKTDVVIVKATGDVQLTSGGWYTTTTMYAMNDVLQRIHIQVRAAGNPKEGNWTVAHPGGVATYYDDMVIPASRELDKGRAQHVMQRARELGIACFVYVKNPALGGQRVPGAGAAAPAACRPAAPAPPARPAGTAGAPSGGWGMVAAGGAQSSVGVDKGRPRSYQEQWNERMQAQAQSAAATGFGPGPGLDAGADGLSLDLAEQMAEVVLSDGPAPKLTAEHFESYLMDDVLDEDTACVACMARPRDTIIVPCGHLVLCSACSSGITSCPMCRVAVTELVSLG